MPTFSNKRHYVIFAFCMKIKH